MSIPSSNQKAFGRIKSALSQSMHRAMGALSQTPGSTAPLSLDSVSHCLHQIQGSLKMVELDAASMLAGDLQELSVHLVEHNTIDSNAELVAVLKRGLESLNKYLEAIEAQTPESPLALVHDINTVRKSIGRQQITSYELFNPPLNLHPMISPGKPLDYSEDNRRLVVAHLRQRFRLALLSWLKNENPTQSLTIMIEMMTHLQKVSVLEVLQQLWWVAAGFVESVRESGIEVDSRIKSQFVRLDTELSRMANDDGASIASSPPDELLRQILFSIGSIAIVHKNNELSQRAKQIIDQFELDQWFVGTTGTQVRDEYAASQRLIELDQSDHDSLLDVRPQMKIEPTYARSVVMDEINTNLSKMESLISTIDFDDVDQLRLVPISGYLNDLSDCLEILEAKEIMQLSRQTALKFTQMQAVSTNFNKKNINRIAFAIASIGTCVEQIDHEKQNSSNIINRAQQVLDNLDPLVDMTENERPHHERITRGSELSGIVEISENGAGGTKIVADQLDQLDEIRRKLRTTDDEKAQLIRLVSLFSAIQHSTDFHKSSKTSILAAIGKSLIQNTIDETVAIDSDAENFIGLISRQMRQLESKASLSSEVDLVEWQTKFESIIDGQRQNASAQSVEIRNKPRGLDDPQLRDIFVNELIQYTDTLDEVIVALNRKLNDSGTNGDRKITLNHTTTIDRLIHSLSGSFTNLGLREIGESVGQLETLVKVDSEDATDIEIYRDKLIIFNDLLVNTVIEIEDQHAIAQNTRLQYQSLPQRFKNPKSKIIRNAIPLVMGNASESKNGANIELDVSTESQVDSRDINIVFETTEKPQISAPGPDVDNTDQYDEPKRADGKIKQIFLKESESRLNRINGHLAQWRLNAVSKEILDGIRRELHTLKGSAAAIGFDDVSKLSHAVESLLEQRDNKIGSHDSSLLNLLEEMHDGLATELGFIPGVNEGHIGSLIRMVEILISDETASAGDGPSIVEEDGHPGHATQRITPANIIRTRAKPYSLEPDSESLRIENAKISDLLNYSEELGLIRNQLKKTLNGTRAELSALRSSTKRIREGLLELDSEVGSLMHPLAKNKDPDSGDGIIDPLQFDRISRLQAKTQELSSHLDDLARLDRNLNNRVADLDGALIQQFHVGELLQNGLMNTRMIPIDAYLPRLRRLVRDTSRRLGKPVKFMVEGGHIEVDRRVLDAMMPPFEHMIRNAIIHGIESASQRQHLNKSADGQIFLKAIQQGSELLMELKDDGQGLDREKLSKRAVETGLVLRTDDSIEDHLLQIIIEPGYSTAETVSLDAGRGVGLDVVYQAVKMLGGSMALSSRSGEGVSFQFRLPVTMTVAQGLLLNVGTIKFAILTRTIERVMRVRENELQLTDGQCCVAVGEKLVPVFNLAERLGEANSGSKGPYKSLVFVRIEDRVAALEVDQFEEIVDIVPKAPGSQLTSINGVIGATILADSSIVVILDPSQFVDWAVMQSDAFISNIVPKQHLREPLI